MKSSEKILFVSVILVPVVGIFHLDFILLSLPFLGPSLDNPLVFLIFYNLPVSLSQLISVLFPSNPKSV